MLSKDSRELYQNHSPIVYNKLNHVSTLLHIPDKTQEV